MQGRNPRCPPLVSADTFDPTSPLNVVTVKAGTVVITTVESVITMIVVVAAQLQPPRPQHTLQDLERFAHNRHLSIWVRICFGIPGQKPPFYPEITKNLTLEKCEFCEE